MVVELHGQRVMSVSESHGESNGEDRGAVNALWNALGKDLGPYQASTDDMNAPFDSPVA